jgi:hypothetical protein
MTDRIKGLSVTLRPDMRDDDAERVISAIRLLSGVIDVCPHVADLDHYFAVTTARQDLIKKLWDVLK